MGFRVYTWHPILLHMIMGLLIGQLLRAGSMTEPGEIQALLTFKESLVDRNDNLRSWTSATDPCHENDPWLGVVCSEDELPPEVRNTTSFSHVTSLRLMNLNLSGELVPELGDLKNLRVLNVMWNNMSGGIPASIGTLSNLRRFLVNSNRFSGPLPPEIGNLQTLRQLQVDVNQLSGPLPSTLTNLTAIRHLHLNNNSFTGNIPENLGTLPRLLHVLLDNNRLTGPLPSDLANAPTLETIQLDNNRFTSSIPEAWTRISTLWKLSLRNCSLNGSLLDFSPSGNLSALDLSYNQFSGPISELTLPSKLTTLDLSYNRLSGPLPQSLGNLQNLSFLALRANNFSGDIPANLGQASSFTNAAKSSDGVQDSDPSIILDLQSNSLRLSNDSNLVQIASQNEGVEVWLSGNPQPCPTNGSANPLCISRTLEDAIDIGITQPGEVLNAGIECFSCKDPLLAAPAAQQSDCRCATYITIVFRLASPTFQLYHVNEDELKDYITDSSQIHDKQLYIRDFTYRWGPRIDFSLLLFPPSGQDFNATEEQRLTTLFIDSNLSGTPLFGPYEVVQFIPPVSLKGGSGSDGIGRGAVAAIAVTATIVGLLAILMAWLWWGKAGKKLRSKGKRTLKRRKINVAGVRTFSFKQMVKATGGFSEKNLLGEGGYGKVYKGTLEDGHTVAIKRAESESLQGVEEFENEIQLLSRVHHRNLVGLLGYCNDQGEHANGEQMLVYEFVENGNLGDHLYPYKEKAALDLPTRMRIAIGSARGLHYLHTQAKPPIFHRDIKAANILLDGKYNAKVSDFGLSKLACSTEADFEGVNLGYVSTVVKGTPGYLDPEYLLTRQLTDRSDVYSFGVVLLQLITGKRPITQGKHIAREVNSAYHTGDISSVIDPSLDPHPEDLVRKFLRLALGCCHDNPDVRPNMTDVLHELGEIWRDAPWSDAASSTSNLNTSRFNVESSKFRGEWSNADYTSNQRDMTATDFTGSRATSASEAGALLSNTNINVLPR